MKKIQMLFAKTKSWQVALVIFFLGFILYANTLDNQLFWDDYDSIVNNVYIRSWDYLPKYFSENLTAGVGVVNDYWRPLLLFSFSLDYHIAGLSPFIYHFQNFLWHFLASFLVYLIILKFSKNKLASFLASLIFLAHPLQTEAVTYAAGRADPMHTALMLGAFWFFLKYLEINISIKYLFYSLILFTVALLTKERAIVFPAIIAVYFLTLYPGKIFEDWKNKLKIFFPFIAIALIYIILRLTFFHFTNVFDLGQPNNIGAENFGEKLLMYLKGISVYTGLMFWPAKLYMEKTLSMPSSVFNFYVISGFVLILLSFLSILYSLKNRRIIAFGMLWFWIFFSPSFYVYPIQSLLYEHWLYCPLIGLLICLALFVSDLFLKKDLNILKLTVFFVLISFIFGLSIRTIIRNNDWQDPITFYEKNISLGGYSGRVYTNLGMAYADLKKDKEAIAAYKKAIEIEENLFQPWYDMGNSFNALGKTNEAIEAYQKSIEINPYFIPAYNNLSRIFVDQKKTDEAVTLLQKANEKNPKNIQLLYNLGIVYSQEGDKAEAHRYFKEALALDPTNIDLIKASNAL